MSSYQLISEAKIAKYSTSSTSSGSSISNCAPFSKAYVFGSIIYFYPMIEEVKSAKLPILIINFAVSIKIHKEK